VLLVATVLLIFNSCIKTKEAQVMLNENIKNLRKAKGLSQEELAVKLNVVRQTVSKWEKGLSVPDSNMLISLADELDTSVSILLGETVQEPCVNELDLKSISEKLEKINLQFAKRSKMRIQTIRYLLFALCAVIIVVFVAFAAMQSEYLNWDYNDPELAVAGTILHGVEFLFVRLAPFALIGSIIGIIFTYKNR
jgi:putative transcriptional regulator